MGVSKEALLLIVNAESRLNCWIMDATKFGDWTAVGAFQSNSLHGGFLNVLISKETLSGTKGLKMRPRDNTFLQFQTTFLSLTWLFSWVCALALHPNFPSHSYLWRIQRVSQKMRHFPADTSLKMWQNSFAVGNAGILSIQYNKWLFSGQGQVVCIYRFSSS